MSKSSTRELDMAPVSEEALVDYLLRHPDFFERHSGVLTKLRIPHERNGHINDGDVGIGRVFDPS